jgi:hypothetical protein
MELFKYDECYILTILNWVIIVLDIELVSGDVVFYCLVKSPDSTNYRHIFISEDHYYSVYRFVLRYLYVTQVSWIVWSQSISE